MIFHQKFYVKKDLLIHDRHDNKILFQVFCDQKVKNHQLDLKFYD